MSAMLAACDARGIDESTPSSTSTQTNTGVTTAMTSGEQNNDSAEIIRVMHAYHAAMVEARTDDLDQLLDKEFSLAHITGYIQPKDEWFGVIRSGQFDYHRIDIEEETLAVNITGSTAVVTGRGIFNATINGMRNPWRLQFTMECARQNGRWTITRARYTSF